MLPAVRPALRPLLVLLALLVLAPAGAASGKPRKPAEPACAPGAVVMKVQAARGKPRKGRRATPAAKLVCRDVLGKGAARSAADGAQKIARSALARLRKTLPKRLRGRFPAAPISRLDAALRRARTGATAASAPAAIRAGGATDCDGPGTVTGPEEEVKDGIRVRASAQRWGELQTPTGGSGRDTTVTLPSGASKREASSTCTSWDRCPDADGHLAGRYVSQFTQSLSAAKDSLSITYTMTIRVEGSMTATVGADGRLTTFDWDAEGTGAIRAEARQNGKLIKYVSVGTVRTVMHGTGANPRDHGAMPQRPDVGAWGSLNGVLEASNEPTIELVKSVANVARGLPGDVSFNLLMAEKVFYDEAGCLDVVFDPDRPEAQLGQQLAVAVRVKAKDGAEVPATYDATALTGSVAAEHATTPGPTTWTAPAEGRGWTSSFKVEAVSKRGRAIGTHTVHLPEQTWWQVTFEGSGTYGRDEPRGIPYPHLTAAHAFTWKTTYEPIRLPAFDDLPDQPGHWGVASLALTGTLTAKRVDGGGTDTCTAQPDPDKARVGGWIQARRHGDDFVVSATAFNLLVPPFDTACGTFDDLLQWTRGTGNAMTADVTVGWAQRSNEDQLTFAVSPTRALQPCDGGEANGDFACTQSVTWTGTIRMKKVAPPAGATP